MGASTKFLTPPTQVNYTDELTVLISKKGDDLVRLFGKRNLIGLKCVVKKKLLVGNAFDFGQLIALDSLEVGKVKTQPVGFNKESLLA